MYTAIMITACTRVIYIDVISHKRTENNNDDDDSNYYYCYSRFDCRTAISIIQTLRGTVRGRRGPVTEGPVNETY